MWAALSEDAQRFDLRAVRDAVTRFPTPRHDEPPEPEMREAAVLLALFERDGEANLVYIKRPDHMPTHQGQIAFPGGTRDPGDIDLRATALRETWEEVGVRADAVEVLGGLDALSTIATPFFVSPFIGVLGEEPTFTPDPSEVEVILEVPLSELFHAEAFREEFWEMPADLPRMYGRPERNVLFFEIPGETIWGATARITADFLARLAATRL